MRISSLSSYVESLALQRSFVARPGLHKLTKLIINTIVPNAMVRKNLTDQKII